MPTRILNVDGRDWRVFPSGFVTPNVRDEFGLIFIHGTGEEREVRVVRYSPVGVRWREQSLAQLGDDELRALFAESQPSFTSPEAGYLP